MLLKLLIYSLHLVIWDEGCSSFSRFSALGRAGRECVNHCHQHWLLLLLGNQGVAVLWRFPLWLIVTQLLFPHLWLKDFTMLRVCQWPDGDWQFPWAGRSPSSSPCCASPRDGQSQSIPSATADLSQLFSHGCLSGTGQLDAACVGQSRSVWTEQVRGTVTLALYSSHLRYACRANLDTGFLKLLRSGSG